MEPPLLKKRQIEHSLENEFENPSIKSTLAQSPVDLVRAAKKFQFGNYDKYYSIRYKEKWQDGRMAILKPNYFLNKECLDIGCNDGSFTLMLAIRFFPKHITGIDIDYTLINKAVQNLQNLIKEHGYSPEKTQKKQQIQSLLKKLEHFPKSFLLNTPNLLPLLQETPNIDSSLIPSALLPPPLSSPPPSTVIPSSSLPPPSLLPPSSLPSPTLLPPSLSFPTLPPSSLPPPVLLFPSSRPPQSVAAPSSLTSPSLPPPSSLPPAIISRFPDNISFRIENYIQDLSSSEKFDTILCLSLTKWIHLNWGDTGIRRLFKKVADSIRKGGLFILEPQDWKAYKKKKCLNEEFKKNYR